MKNELENSEIELKNFKESNRGYNDSPELFMIYSQKFREVEAKKEVYMTLQQQLELARIEEVKRSPILHILDHAVSPIKKSSPNRLAFLIISSIVGFNTSYRLLQFSGTKDLKKNKICVVGVGNWGMNHVKTLHTLNVTVGCVDTDSKIRKSKVALP